MTSLLDKLTSPFRLPPLRVPSAPPPEPKTADTPEGAVRRLRDLVDKQRGWGARVAARKAEIAELTPENPAESFDISDAKLTEIANHQVQIALAEAALDRIRDDEAELIDLACTHVENLAAQVAAAARDRLTAVEEKARTLARPIFPEDKIERAIALLPTVAEERGIAAGFASRGSAGLSYMWSGGPNGRPIPRPGETTAHFIVTRVDSLTSLLAEVRARADAPIVFVGAVAASNGKAAK